MTQQTPTIGADQSGVDYRTQDNNGKKALLNHHKGAAAPSYAEAGIIWLDDAATPWVLKIYDGADWIKLGDVNASTNAFFPYNGTAAPRLLNDAADTGAVNAYAVAPVPAITAYAAGQIVLLRPVNASTGACTLAVSGLAAKNIKLMDGGNPVSGAIAVTNVYQLVYDGTNFVLLNPSLGSAAYLNAGTAANNLVQLNGSAKLPAVDGSLLTNLPASGPALASTAETQAGTSTTKATTPAGIKGALGFSKYYESAETSVTASTSHSFTHALGAAPKMVQAEFVCKTADAGYAADDRVKVSEYWGTSSFGLSVFYNATEVGLNTGSVITFINKGTFGGTNLTLSRWKLVVRAWA